MTIEQHFLAHVVTKPFQSLKEAHKKVGLRLKGAGTPWLLSYKRTKSTKTGKTPRHPTKHWEPLLGGVIVLRCNDAQMYDMISEKLIMPTYQQMMRNDVADFKRFWIELEQANRKTQEDFEAWQGAKGKRPDYQPGDKLKVLSGPFADKALKFSGFIERAGTLHVELGTELLGKTARVTLPATDVWKEEGAA